MKRARSLNSGAGSGGSSAAYYINRFTQSCDRVRVTVYERNPYIGGRSTTINVHDDPDEPVEQGGSVFVKINHNLMHAVEKFGLVTQGGFDAAKSKKSEDLEDSIGVYDGKGWRYISPWDPTDGWWTMLKLLWQYGSAPVRTQTLMKSVVASFTKMYDDVFPFPDLTQAVREVGLEDVAAINGEELLRQNNIGKAFSEDIIQASTRVNYAQNLDGIHGVETMVCMAADGAMSVKGGNWQMFAGMLDHSNALVLLNTTVTDISYRKESSVYSIDWKNVDQHGEQLSSEEYDHVILAAPHQFSDITINPRTKDPIPAIPYVELHVTLFASPHRLNPTYFNLPSDAQLPKTILTTISVGDKDPGFNSISTLRAIINPHNGEREYLYKIFSHAPLTTDFFMNILEAPIFTAPHTDLDPRDVSWKVEKVWHSYPVEHPRTSFENITYSLEGGGKLWYTSSVEGFISTMETSSLMGMNVARLLVNEWMDEVQRNTELKSGLADHEAKTGASEKGREGEEL